MRVAAPRQIFSCGQKEYRAHANVIAHASAMSMAAHAPVTDVKHHNIRIANIQLVYVELAQFVSITYGLRTFNSSMWNSLRLAPIIYALSTVVEVHGRTPL